MDYQQIIMEIIVNGGNARSNALLGIKEAKNGEITKAKELIELAEQDLSKAHRVQTDLIQAETRGEKSEITLLMVHAQDHLMNAMTVKELATELIDVYQKMNN
ncbi:PTS lactose/cellobiose transporter subunit IIA [Oceanobacillus manasiensis]|uniref:PTS lactose/cellobiose transporter subunit IIA n=1 Tax=Oceanobacillus manasiensis TaxID=586413 RepID=UPI0005A62830|nr:PTS lactose/cellobiose transporter subunit IIA [Oceanobacillus manasiensis]